MVIKIKKLIKLIKSLFNKKAKQIISTTKITTKLIASTSKSEVNNRQSIANLAVNLTNDNIPYLYGGDTLKGMDCSGIVEYVFDQVLKANYPHQTILLEAEGQYQSISQANIGDLLFWGNKGNSYHVAIYIGNNQFVHSPDVGQTVSIETINSYFKPSFSIKPYIYINGRLIV